MRHIFHILALLAFLAPLGAAPAFAQKLGVAALVNEEMISTLDVDDRVRFVIATTGLSDSEEIRAKLRPQMVRALIDEKLELQEAERKGITVSQDEVTRGIAIIEQQRGRPQGSLLSYIADRGVPPTVFEQQLKAQIAWTKLAYRVLRPQIHISDEEVARAAPRFTKSGEQEVQIATILLPVDNPARETSVKTLADKLVGEIRGGADFDAVASQFTAGGAGAQAFWVQESLLDPRVTKALGSVKTNGVTEPVRTDSGYQIIRLLGRRAGEGGTGGGTTEVALKQIVLSLRPDAKTQEVDTLMSIARAVAKHPGACDEKGIAGLSDIEGANIAVNLARIPVNRLSPQIRTIVSNLPVGAISEPFATPKGIQLLMLCEKVDMPVSAGDLAKARERLFQEKMELEAVKYLRNLRREAFIDIRD